jgi:hypothetical protein
MREQMIEVLRAAWPRLDVHGPPALWEPAIDREPVLALLGVLIDRAAADGSAMTEVRLLLNNVTVEPEREHDHATDVLGEDAALVAPPGDFVARSVLSGRRWVEELSWRDGDEATLLDREVDDRARAASVVYAYARVLDDVSLTCFVPRAPSRADTDAPER